MIQAPVQSEEGSRKAGIPQRDWLLIPLISIATLCFLVAGAEWAARHVYPQSKTDIYTCLAGNRTPNGILNGIHGIPDAVCQGNNRDTPMTSYHLNGWGHREDANISPKSSAVLRVMLLGSSVAFGEGVPQSRTFADLLPKELARITGRRIELYNAGMFGEVPDVIAQHFAEAVPVQPDLILWVLTAHDLKDTVIAPVIAKDLPVPTAATAADSAPTRQGTFAARIWRSIRVTFARKSAAQALADLWQHGVDHIYGTSSAVVLLQHLLYQNQAQYLRSYLESGDAAFLRKPLSPDWHDHLQQFGYDDEQIEAAAQKARIPVVAVLLPNAAQAIMISTGNWPTGFDPYVLDTNLRSIVVSHGGRYIGILPFLKNLSNPEQYFFQVNGHPNTEGHALIAELLRRAMTSGTAPVLPPADRQNGSGH